MSGGPCYSEDVQASAGTLHPCTGESGGSTRADTALVSYLGYSFSSCTLAVSPKGPQ